MRLQLALFLFASSATLLVAQQYETPQLAAPLRAQGFQARQEDSSTAAAVQYRGGYEYEQEEEEEPQYQLQQRRQQQQQQQQQQRRPAQNNKKFQAEQQAELDEEQEEEPDRLSLLLEKSSFNCNERNTGYYADESLACEVFHYCQESQKHSWICPEGFTFHQVHLICMPPSGDNICDQSSKYTIVNDYLYKPINEEEHQRKPNVTLRYSERYYPESFYHDERQDYAEDRSVPAQRTPIQVGFSGARKAAPSPAPQQYRQPQPTQHNVFRSPEEINISLQQRRPQHLVYQQSTSPRYEEEYNYEK